MTNDFAIEGPEPPRDHLPEDTADYGPYPGSEAVTYLPGPDETYCLRCGAVAIDHGPGRFSAYGVCPDHIIEGEK